MYSLNVEPSEAHFPSIKRKMSADKAIELLPVVVEICRIELQFINPVALSIGGGVYRIFDLENPDVYADITIMEGLS